MLFTLINLICFGLTAAMIVVMLIFFRRERRIKVGGMLVSLFLSVLILPVFIWLSGARLNWGLGLLLLGGGVLVGVIRGQATRLYFQGQQVVARNSMLFLLGWIASLLISQLLTTFGSVLWAAVGLMPLFVSTGTQVGMQGNILVRRLLMRPPSLGVEALGLPER